MPKYTFPALYDEAQTVCITKLKEWGYLKPGQYKTGVISWSSHGRKTGSISIAVNTNPHRPYLELSYQVKSQPVKYRVELVSVPSNIGKGVIWYFLCPATGKRCRKLYGIGAKFLHREAYSGCMYEVQTHSRYYRHLEKVFGPALRIDELYQQLYKPYFKTHYAGKPTKRYLELTKKIRQARQTDPGEIEALI